MPRRARLGRRRDSAPWSFPLDRTQQRELPADYDGDIHIWDIDQTYLVSDYESLRGLLAIPLELAVDKRNVAGAEILLRALRRGPSQSGRVASNPLYFVSASPPQLRSVLERKMLLDGVEFDGIAFKDQLALLRSGRMARLREHVGYKLAALLLYRRELPWTARETTFGDDTEHDALVYALYADVAAGRLRGEELRATLEKNEVHPEDADYVVRLAADLPAGEVVQRIYIHLAKGTRPGAFAAWGPRLVPCRDCLQMATHLWSEGKIAEPAVAELARSLRADHRWRPVAVARSLFELVDRHLLAPDELAELWPTLREEGSVPAWVRIEPVEPTEGPPPIPSSGHFFTPERYRA